MYVRMYVCPEPKTNNYFHTCVGTFMHAWAHTQIQTYRQTDRHTDRHTYVHRYIRIYIHAYTQRCTKRLAKGSLNSPPIPPFTLHPQATPYKKCYNASLSPVKLPIKLPESSGQPQTLNPFKTTEKLCKALTT